METGAGAGQLGERPLRTNEEKRRIVAEAVVPGALRQPDRVKLDDANA